MLLELILAFQSSHFIKETDISVKQVKILAPG